MIQIGDLITSLAKLKYPSNASGLKGAPGDPGPPGGTDPASASAAGALTGSEVALVNPTNVVGAGVAKVTTLAINNYIYTLLGLWKTFDTVAQMKAGASPTYPRVKWRGYYAAGDGGGGEGYYSTASATADEGHIFATTAGGYVTADVPPGNISMNRFGVIGAPDVTTAAVQFQRCNDFAYSIHREYEVSPSSYGGQSLGQTVNITTACGPITAAPQIDGTNRGVYWQFVPTKAGSASAPLNTPLAADDWMPCFTVSHANFYIKNLCVNGPTAYSSTSLVADGFVDATKFKARKLSALAPGYVGLQCIGSAKGTFENCVTLGGLKCGFMYSTSTGHINQISHVSSSLYGVFIDQNSEDYKFHSGGFGGILGYLLMSTRLCAGHYGGCNAIVRDLHLGFTTRPIHQLLDDVNTPNITSCTGFYGTIDGGSIEQIGECLIDVLNFAGGYFTISNCRISQTGFSNSRPAAGNSFTGMCQVELDPTEGFQAYMLRLGQPQSVNCFNSNFYVSPWTNAQVTGTVPTVRAAAYVDKLYNTDNRQGCYDWTAFESVVFGSDVNAWNNASYKAAPIYRPDMTRGNQGAMKGDLQIPRSVAPVGNMLMDPEARTGTGTTSVPTNWGSYTSNGVIVGGYLSEWLALSTNPFGGAPWDPRMFADLKDNPFIIQVKAVAAGQVGIYLNAADQTARPYRLFCADLWRMSQPATAGANIEQFFSLRTPGAVSFAVEDCSAATKGAVPLVWTKRKLTQFAYQAPGGTANAIARIGVNFNATAAGDTVWLCGVMCALDEHAPYNRYPGPAIDTPVYLTGQTVTTAAPAAGAAAALPATPTGYKLEYINGVAGKIPFY